MMFDKKVVLDHDNHPVRDFEDIPATLSSEAEGWLLEAISRIDRRITKVDLRARMVGIRYCAPSPSTDRADTTILPAH